MNTNNKIHTAADELTFGAAGEKEISVINKSRNKVLFKNFKKRAVISVIIGIIVAIGEYIGRTNQHLEKTIGATFAFIIAAVAVFNLLSYGYIVLKRKMDLYADTLEILYCTVSEKYNQYQLADKDNKHPHNYILLETDTLYCTTAFPVNNIRDYNKIAVGDTVLLLKNSSYGDSHYEVFTNIN